MTKVADNKRLTALASEGMKGLGGAEVTGSPGCFQAKVGGTAVPIRSHLAVG